MEPITAGFYGIICGALAALAPHLGRVWVRLISGAIVGVAASWALPMVRSSLGMY